MRDSTKQNPLHSAPTACYPSTHSNQVLTIVDDGNNYPEPPDFNEALTNRLTARQRQSSAGVEHIYSRKQIETAFLETFDLIGGVPRLALWANNEENYGLFLQLLLKLAPKEAAQAMKGQVLEYRSNLPSSPLVRNEREDITDV